jgi:hypothetical protein
MRFITGAFYIQGFFYKGRYSAAFIAFMHSTA